MPTGVTDWRIATDYASIAAAIAALPSGGGTVYVPSGTYNSTSPTTYTAPLILPAGKSVHLIGAGPELTVLQDSAATNDMVLVRGSYSSVTGLTLQGPGGNGPGRGIVIGDNVTPTPIRRPRLADLVIRDTSSWSIYAMGYESSPPNTFFSILATVERVECRRNVTSTGGIFIGQGCTTYYLKDCTIDTFKGVGVSLHGCEGVSLIDCDIEGPADDTAPFIALESTTSCLLEKCWFETSAKAQTQRFVSIIGENRNTTLSACKFVRYGSSDPLILSAGSKAASVVVINPEIAADAPISGTNHFDVSGVDSEFTLVGGVVADSAGGFTRPTVNVTSDRAAILNGTARVRVPRVSSTAIVVGPAAGDVVFDIGAAKLRAFDGSLWRDLW